MATGYVKNKYLLITSMVFAAIVPFFRDPSFTVASYVACFLFVFLLLTIMIKHKDTLKLEQIGLVFMLSTLVPFAFSSLIYLKNFYIGTNLWRRDGVFLVILAMAGSWVADAGAYFVGRIFGKHKLAPNISPNKTYEGFVGGVLFNIIGFVVACLAFQWFDSSVSFNWPMIILLAVLCAFAGTVGDLSASFIKRSCHIKDFGKLMPGHGGVLDRFDSVMVVAPMLYVWMVLFQPNYPIIIR